MRRYLKDGPTRLTMLKKQGTLCLAQMGNLSEAIRQGATEDANGTPNDERTSNGNLRANLESRTSGVWPWTKPSDFLT